MHGEIRHVTFDFGCSDVISSVYCIMKYGLRTVKRLVELVCILKSYTGIEGLNASMFKHTMQLAHANAIQKLWGCIPIAGRVVVSILQLYYCCDI